MMSGRCLFGQKFIFRLLLVSRKGNHTHYLKRETRSQRLTSPKFSCLVVFLVYLLIIAMYISLSIDILTPGNIQ